MSETSKNAPPSAGVETASSSQDLNAKFELSDSETKSQNSSEEIDGDYGSYRDHLFTDPEVEKYWTEVMNRALYEGRHRFDATFTWSASEEKKVRRKVSYVVDTRMRFF